MITKVNKRMNRKKRLTRLLASTGLLAITLIWLLPIVWMIVSSFRDSSDPFYLGVLPSYLTLASYRKVLSNPLYLNSMRNSAYVAFMAACVNLVISTLAAYGFSRFQFAGKKSFQSLLLIVRLFPGILLAITLFRVAGNLGIYDTHVPLIIANVLFTLPLATWNLRTMFENLPVELEEAAWLDGTTRIGAIVRVLSPLMLPSLVTTWAYVFLLSWNEYMFALSFIRTPEKQMITTAIAANIGQYTVDYNSLVAASVLASIPLLIVFLFIQRYIISGQTVGAVRG
jgi:multiple sugar transport system permease protein